MRIFGFSDQYYLRVEEEKDVYMVSLLVTIQFPSNSHRLVMYDSKLWMDAVCMEKPKRRSVNPCSQRGGGTSSNVGPAKPSNANPS